MSGSTPKGFEKSSSSDSWNSKTVGLEGCQRGHKEEKRERKTENEKDLGSKKYGSRVSALKRRGGKREDVRAGYKKRKEKKREFKVCAFQFEKNIQVNLLDPKSPNHLK